MRKGFFEVRPEDIAGLPDNKQALFLFMFYLEEKLRELNDALDKHDRERVVLVANKTKVETNIEKTITLILNYDNVA